MKKLFSFISIFLLTLNLSSCVAPDSFMPEFSQPRFSTNTAVDSPYEQPSNAPYSIPVTQTSQTDVVAAPISPPPPIQRRTPLFGQSIFSIQKPRISVAQRNAVLESLTNYEWVSVNKHNISNKYLFRVDDNGLIMSYARLDTGKQSPEYYLYETPRGYQLDFPAMSAYLKFWLSENGALVKSVKVGRSQEDIYAMMPQARGEIYDDDIF